MGAIGGDRNIETQGSGDLLFEHGSGFGNIQFHRSVQQPSGFRYPSNRLASVTVGSSPPLP